MIFPHEIRAEVDAIAHSAAEGDNPHLSERVVALALRCLDSARYFEHNEPTQDLYEALGRLGGMLAGAFAFDEWVSEGRRQSESGTN